MKDEIERRVVAPVHVLEREEYRLRARERGHDLRRARETIVACPIRDRSSGLGRRVGKKRPELGEYRDERAAAGAKTCATSAGEADAANSRTRSRSGAYGIDRSASKQAPCKHEEARGARFFGHRAQKTRFADARFADDQRDVSLPLATARQDSTRGSELQIATDQGRTDDVVV